MSGSSIVERSPSNTGSSEGRNLSLAKGRGGGVFDKLDTDLFAKVQGYLERTIDLCMQNLQDPGLEAEEKRKRAHCLTQQVAALVNLKRVMGQDASKDEDLAELLEKLPKRVLKRVEREVGQRAQVLGVSQAFVFEPEDV